ncbi:hypothetical protein Dda_4037 [Drechslerella dactyloides]|uniref:Uncharacterized protein n=1 Tax=Drechslerella dactyloides TaxID=74499 RepID=A0AAD6NKB6_DREDA|nr:hypothetical protein Dda_4037 [Drechslerella dactyloides]
MIGGSLWLGVALMVWTPYLLTLPTYSIIVQDFTSLVYVVVAAMMMAVEVCGAEEEWSNRCREVFRSLIAKQKPADNKQDKQATQQHMKHPNILYRLDSHTNAQSTQYANELLASSPELERSDS